MSDLFSPAINSIDMLPKREKFFPWGRGVISPLEQQTYKAKTRVTAHRLNMITISLENDYDYRCGRRVTCAYTAQHVCVHCMKYVTDSWVTHCRWVPSFPGGTFAFPHFHNWTMDQTKKGGKKILDRIQKKLFSCWKVQEFCCLLPAACCLQSVMQDAGQRCSEI